MFCYNFHHIHRGLRLTLDDGTRIHRTPAVAAGLASAPLSVADILAIRVPGFVLNAHPTVSDFEQQRPPGPAP